MARQRLRNLDLEKFWRQAHERRKTSGLTVKAFCESEGLIDHQYWYWGREFRARDRTAKADNSLKKTVSRKAAASSKAKSLAIKHLESAVLRQAKADGAKSDSEFAPVRLTDGDKFLLPNQKTPSSQNIAEIVLRSGRMVRIPSEFPLHLLGPLLSAVEEN
jgi:transposase-like protein